MDSITQITLGAAIGEACLGKKSGIVLLHGEPYLELCQISI
jgi:hypothetical protein